MRNIFLSLLIFIASIANAGLDIKPTEMQRQYFNRGEMLIDPGFEKGNNAHATTSQPGSTFGTSCMYGRCLTWNPSGADILYFDSKVVKAKTSGYLHGQCFFSMSDSTHTYTLELYDYSNSKLLASQVLPADSSHNFIPVDVEALITPDDTNDRDIRLRVQATADEAVIYDDECSMSLNQKASVGTVSTGWKSYTPASSQQGFGILGTVSIQYRREGPDLVMKGYFQAGTVSSNQARFDLPDGLVIASNVQSGESAGVYFREGTATGHGGNVIISGGNTYLNFSNNGVFSNTSTAANSAANGDAVTSTSGYVDIGMIRVPIQGWDAGLDKTNDQIDWRVDANITGANPSLGTSDTSSYTGIENSSLTLTNNTSKGSLTCQIPCSSTNAPSGTTCSSGNESVGITCPYPTTGYVRVCAEFAHRISTTTSGTLNTTFQIVKTSNNAQFDSNSVEGGSRLQSSLSAGTGSISHPFNLCGNFFIDSVGYHTFRVMYEQNHVGTVSENLILADADSNVGQRDIHWTVTPLVHYGNILQQQNRSTTKYLASNITSSTNPVASLAFSNLVIGKRYQVYITPRIDYNSTGSVIVRNIVNGSDVAGFILQAANGTAYKSTLVSPPFVATATTMSTAITVSGTMAIYGNGTLDYTYIELKELNNEKDGGF